MAKIPQKPPQGFEPEDRAPAYLRREKSAQIPSIDPLRSVYEDAGLAEAGARYWVAMDGWSLEESSLLLLGIDPSKLAKLAPAFVNALHWPEYESELVRALHRAAEMDVLGFPAKPVDVLDWAHGRFPMTAELQVWRAKGPAAKQDDRLSAPADRPAATEAERATGAPGTTVWTDERKAEARAYRQKHGLKKTAEHYRVSQTTISKHIPPVKPEPTNHGAWGGLIKK